MTARRGDGIEDRLVGNIQHVVRRGMAEDRDVTIFVADIDLAIGQDRRVIERLSCDLALAVQEKIP